MSSEPKDACAARHKCITTSDADKARTVKCNNCARRWHLRCREDGLVIYQKCLEDKTFSEYWYCARPTCQASKEHRLALEQAVYVPDSDEDLDNPEEPLYVTDSDNEIEIISVKPAPQPTVSGSVKSSTIPIVGPSTRASPVTSTGIAPSISKAPFINASQQPTKRARVENDDDSVRKRAKACNLNVHVSSPAASPSNSIDPNKHTGAGRLEPTRDDDEGSSSDGEFGAWARPPFSGTGSRSCSPGGTLTLREYIEGTTNRN
ncbi:hypothetical protein PENSPDRAFT_688483 [Peniophora sp. CONT]|nr:hypothetical protein PENSPDRAFT_688483 [Peniophora sp. CONT]